jgi:hypothetical protein
MGTADNLQTSVLSVRLIDCDEATDEIREETAIVIPIAIVLMPFPCAIGMRVLENKFMVPGVNFCTQKFLCEIDQLIVPREPGEDVFPKPVGDPKLHILSRVVLSSSDLSLKFRIKFGNSTKKIDQVQLQEPRNNQETGLMKMVQVRLFDANLRHDSNEYGY